MGYSKSADEPSSWRRRHRSGRSRGSSAAGGHVRGSSDHVDDMLRAARDHHVDMLHAARDHHAKSGRLHRLSAYLFSACIWGVEKGGGDQQQGWHYHRRYNISGGSISRFRL